MENNESLYFEQTPEMTNGEFIEKTRSVLNAILKAYQDNHKRKFNESDELDDNCCSRCGGSCYIEQGGETVECYVCGGSGANTDVVFDTESFSEFIEHSIMFTEEQSFFELIYCNIKEYGK